MWELIDQCCRCLPAERLAHKNSSFINQDDPGTVRCYIPSCPINRPLGLRSARDCKVLKTSSQKSKGFLHSFHPISWRWIGSGGGARSRKLNRMSPFQPNGENSKFFINLTLDELSILSRGRTQRERDRSLTILAGSIVKHTCDQRRLSWHLHQLAWEFPRLSECHR